MDNLTHTLIGALLGETAARTLPSNPQGLPAAARRNLFVTLCAVGSNLPDIDLLYTVGGGKLNYLLHHRGHTHTILGAALLAVLLLAVTEVWMRRAGLRPSRSDRRWLAAIVMLTPLLHIAMDFTNNYGVHPFWPIHNGWLYGDAVFIIEPTFWAACAPLLFLFRTALARVLIALAMVTAVAVGVFTGLVPAAFTAVLVATIAAMLLVGRYAAPRIALCTGIVLWLLVTAIFVTSSGLANRRVDQLAARQFPQARLLDSVVTPLPVNPVCWEVMLVQLQGRRLTVRRAMFSLLPDLLSARECPGRSLDVQLTAPLQSVDAPDIAALQWHGEVSSDRDQVLELAATNCEVAAFMRFARAPFLKTQPQIAGDLRYDREAQPGFAELQIDATPRCPKFVPPWLPPRGDMASLKCFSCAP